VHQAEQSVAPLFLAFLAFILTAIYFNVINLARIRRLGALVRHNIMLMVYINISTAILWLSSFFGLHYGLASMYVAVFFGSVPLFTIFFTCITKDSAKVRSVEWLFSFLISIVLIGLCYDDIIISDSLHNTVICLSLAIVSGAAMAWTVILARRLSLLSFSATEILSQRFYLLIVISAVCLLSADVAVEFSAKVMWLSILVAITSIILPLFFLFKGIEKIDPVFVAFLVPFVPVLTYLIEIWLGGSIRSWLQLSLMLLLSIIIFLSAYLKYRGFFKVRSRKN
jgi:drug/metabolite transporter (DMT)-like permease